MTNLKDVLGAAALTISAIVVLWLPALSQI